MVQGCPLLYTGEQVIIQVCISPHFGVISERLPIADENLLFIGGTLYPTARLCEGNSSALWLAGVARAAPSWRRAAQARGKGSTRVFEPLRLVSGNGQNGTNGLVWRKLLILRQPRASMYCPRQLWCQSSCQGPFRSPSPSAQTPHTRPTPPAPRAYPVMHRHCKRVTRHLLRRNSLGHDSRISRPGTRSSLPDQAAFGLRISDFLRISGFGLRICTLRAGTTSGLAGMTSLTSLFHPSQPFVFCRVRIKTRSPILGLPNRCRYISVISLTPPAGAGSRPR